MPYEMPAATCCCHAQNFNYSYAIRSFYFQRCGCHKRGEAKYDEMLV
jgi:hypothetical protein